MTLNLALQGRKGTGKEGNSHPTRKEGNSDLTRKEGNSDPTGKQFNSDPIMDAGYNGPGRPTTVTLCLPGETGTLTLPERKGTGQQGQGTHQG